jgi:hypothetical protein
MHLCGFIVVMASLCIQLRKRMYKCSEKPYLNVNVNFLTSSVAINFLGIRRGADKSLAFPICSTTKRIFLGWVKEVRTTKP